MVKLPSPEAEAAITNSLDALAKAFENHPQWTTATSPPHPSLYHTWDFIKRSHYIMTELDNILNGRPLKHPEQIPKYSGSPKDNEEKARMSFTDVFTRTITINSIIEDPNKLAMMGLQRIEFGDEIQARAKEVEEAIMSVEK